MQREGLIKTLPDKGHEQFYWTLGKKGFSIISSAMPWLKSNAYKPDSPWHDLLVSAIHAGEFLKEVPKDITLVPERVLKSYPQNLLDPEIPDTTVRIPDGYWLFADGQNISLMALEVEINAKSMKRYLDIAEFYAKFERNQRCLWIVPKRSLAKKIMKAMYEAKPEHVVHNFVDLSEVLRVGWQARIFSGPEKGNSIGNIISVHSEYIKSTMRVPLFHEYIIDTRLSYGIHNESVKRKKLELPDFMGMCSRK